MGKICIQTALDFGQKRRSCNFLLFGDQIRHEPLHAERRHARGFKEATEPGIFVA